MKFLHTSDLHLGKRLNGYSMLGSQEHIFAEILSIAKQYEVDALLIAGDVYDKSMPTVESIEVFDHFLTEVATEKISTFVISGNHDSVERLSFGNKIMRHGGVFISSAFDGKAEPIILSDKFGKVYIWLLPFFKPANVRQFFPEAKIESYTEAMSCVIQQMNIDKSKRNILVAHQFVTGGIRSDSEIISVGGSDNIDCDIFDDFDYVALGHLHRPQNITPKIRYSGSPLKYSFSEVRGEKSVSIITVGEKETLDIETVTLSPKLDLQIIKGEYNTLMSRTFYQKINTDNYMKIVLQDEERITNVMNRLSQIYPNIMEIGYENESKSSHKIEHSGVNPLKSPLDLFCELYELQNEKNLSSEQKEVLEDIIKEVWG